MTLESQPPPPRAHLSDSALAELHETTRKAVAEGIKQGIREAIEDEEIVTAYWTKGISVAKRQARDQAGAILFSSLSEILKRAAQFAMLGMLVYAVGGWSALAGLIKVLFGGETK